MAERPFGSSSGLVRHVITWRRERSIPYSYSKHAVYSLSFKSLNEDYYESMGSRDILLVLLYILATYATLERVPHRAEECGLEQSCQILKPSC